MTGVAPFNFAHAAGQRSVASTRSAPTWILQATAVKVRERGSRC
jgi:hypothetical protein